MSTSQFTERETESYYDAEDTVYRSIWDADGSVHWGVFDESTGSDFLKAGANLNRIMAGRGGIDANSRVLDIGCGNGNACTWLYQNYGCTAVGIDRRCQGTSEDVRPRCRFPRLIREGIGHGAPLRGWKLHPCLEPSLLLPHTRQTQDT